MKLLLIRDPSCAAACSVAFLRITTFTALILLNRKWVFSIDHCVVCLLQPDPGFKMNILFANHILSFLCIIFSKEQKRLLPNGINQDTISRRVYGNSNGLLQNGNTKDSTCLTSTDEFAPPPAMGPLRSISQELNNYAPVYSGQRSAHQNGSLRRYFAF